jgi:hypothetical protein
MIEFNGQVRNLAVTTQPVEEPVTLATAKLHLRVEIADDDALIGALIVAARERCETLTHRAFVSRGYLLTLDGFPFSHAPTVSMAYSSERLPNLAFGRIKIPKPPLIAVQSIAYLDTQGVSQVLDPSAYLVSGGGKLQGVVTPAYGATWPSTRYQVGSVRVAYTAGYGAAADVPASIPQAMLLLIGAWYQNREEFASPTSSLPMGVRALLASHAWGSYG